jgi:hypothetical protein
MFWGGDVRLDAAMTYRTEEFDDQDDPTKLWGINMTIGF